MEKLNDMYELLVALAEEFAKDHAASMEGNKSAARRNRVRSVRIRDILKKYREISIKVA
jgi:hypothetical protein